VPLVSLPQSRRGKLQQVIIRITEVDAHPASRPLRPALQRDTGCREMHHTEAFLDRTDLLIEGKYRSVIILRQPPTQT
jgi:hypothetical protein